MATTQSFTITLAVAACEEVDVSGCQSPAEVERNIAEEFTREFLRRSKSSIRALLERCELFELLVQTAPLASQPDPIEFNISELRTVNTIANSVVMPTKIADIGFTYRVILSAIGRALKQFNRYYRAEEIDDRICEFRALLTEYDEHRTTMAGRVQSAREEMENVYEKEVEAEECQRLAQNFDMLAKCHEPRAPIYEALRRFVEAYERDVSAAGGVATT
jgi:hypothetical protein